MGWAKRGNQPHCYRKRRDEDRVISKYVYSEAVAYEAIKQGLPHLRMGRLIRMPRAELLAWQTDTANKNAALP